MTRRRSYAGAPRVFLTFGVHEDGEWKRMWYVNRSDDIARTGEHFWTWREAIDYALTFSPGGWSRWRHDDALGRKGRVLS